MTNNPTIDGVLRTTIEAYIASATGYDDASLREKLISLLEWDGPYGVGHGRCGPIYQVAARLDNTKSAWIDVGKESFDDYARRGNAWITRIVYTAPPAPAAVVLPELEAAFEKWWEEDGQYCRAGGGSYEKTFAYRAYEAALDATAALNNKPSNEVS